MHKYLKKIGNNDNISSWESKGLSNKVITPPDSKPVPELIYYGKKMYVKF